jgi:hypothetical protein
LEGAHSIPNRKLKNPTLCNAGSPSLNMKMIIRAMTITDDMAVKRKPFFYEKLFIPLRHGFLLL